MALVELYRTTGDRRTSTSPRGSSTCAVTGCSGPAGSASAYWQDHAPVREAPTVAGHAVRQLYLDCGAVDVAVELGDQALLDAVLRRWHDMVATRTLPHRRGRQPPQRRGLRRPVRAAAGPGVRGDLRGDRERDAGVAAAARDRRPGLRRRRSSGRCSTASCRASRATGTEFFYVNPLQRRTNARARPDPVTAERQPWFPCACCPPNVMRTLSSWPQYLATTDDERGPAPPVRHGRRPRRRSPAARSGWPWSPTTRGAARSRDRHRRRRTAVDARRCGSRAGAGRRRSQIGGRTSPDRCRPAIGPSARPATGTPATGSS